jgi:hypothetical protein
MQKETLRERLIIDMDEETSNETYENRSPTNASLKLCQVCFEKKNHYTCPNCALRYCSLACYRSPKHSFCSEEFYRRQVLQEMKGQTTNDIQKQKMQELLRSMNDLELEDSIVTMENHDQRLNKLDSLTVSEIERMLSTEQMQNFRKMINSSEALDALIEVWEPWWYDSNQQYELTVPLENAQSRLNFHLALSIADFSLSYVAVMRTYNGDILDAPFDSYNLLLELSFVLSLKRTNKFQYQDCKQLSDIMRNRIQSHIFKFNNEARFLFYQDLLVILSDIHKTIRALKDLEKLCKAVPSKHGFYNGKKLEYFIWIIEHDCLNAKLILDAVVLGISAFESEWQNEQFVNLSPLVQEILEE